MSGFWENTKRAAVEGQGSLASVLITRFKIKIRLIIADALAKMISILLPSRLMRNTRYFQLWQEKEYHITPVNFYYPIPDTRTCKDDLWEKSSKLMGLNLNDEKQLELLSLFMLKFKSEYDDFPIYKTSIPYQYYLKNGSFDGIDGEILYSMIRYFKPSKIIEIGSGKSTYVSAQAILKNKSEDNNYESELIAIEPYPNNILLSGFPGLSRIIAKKVETVALEEFEKLQTNDILFIDSSHVLKIGSDVQYEYLEILPSLNKGVIVHIHDIFFPLEYPKEWIFEYCWFLNEQYLLQAFLAFNNSFEVLWAGRYLHLKYPHKLEKAFSSYNRMEEKPGSFWIRRK